MRCCILKRGSLAPLGLALKTFCTLFMLKLNLVRLKIIFGVGGTEISGPKPVKGPIASLTVKPSLNPGPFTGPSIRQDV